MGGVVVVVSLGGSPWSVGQTSIAGACSGPDPVAAGGLGEDLVDISLRGRFRHVQLSGNLAV